jgi:3-ketoacyl-CoA synthase
MSAKKLAACFSLLFLIACDISNEPNKEAVCKGETSHLLLRHGPDLTAPVYIGASMAAAMKLLQGWMLTTQLSAQAYAIAFAIGTGACLLVFVAWIIFAVFGKPRVYCVENEVFIPPRSWQMTHEELKTIMQAQGTFTDESTTFLSKTLERSATGQSTHWPPAAHPSKDGKSKLVADMTASREEAEAVIFPIVERVLAKTGIAPKDIDFLIVNCSLFSPTPSLCAMIAHKFKFRQDVRSYNLGGMGCSANVISVDLAKQLIQNQPGTRALVVSTEIITPNLYLGNEKSMLLQNSLFRCGGVALLLSSRR